MRMAIVAVLFAIGCGGGGAGGGDDAPPMIDAPGSQPDAFVPPTGFTKLIGGTWSLGAGQLDTYRCVRLTVANDTYITNIVAQAPAQSHHTVLSISSSQTAGPDGEYACDVGELGMQMLYASGLGTSPLDFPTDVSVRIPAGTQIHLNLHLFNATDDPQTGESAIFIKSQPTPTPILAEMVFAGTFNLSIPSNNQPHNEVGGCTVAAPYTLFAVWPHMHQLATHQKVELIRGTQTTVLHNLDFHFEEQTYYPKTPTVQVQANDNIRVTCTYLNNSGGTVTFGDSSNQEMCFAGFYRYPAASSGLFQCTDVPGGIPGF
ncbi:MAG: hypothetical protein H0T42_24945 [Deltaproteobacteria bacterium]|nr:hypothetical protein [Deltaproteobacteria bacterium]